MPKHFASAIALFSARSSTHTDGNFCVVSCLGKLHKRLLRNANATNNLMALKPTQFPKLLWQDNEGATHGEAPSDE